MKTLYLFVFIILTISMKAQYTAEIENYRNNKKNDYLNSDRSPLKTMDRVEKMDFYTIDETYRCLCEVRESKGEKPFDLPTYSGITRKYIKYAEVTCVLKNEIVKLSIYQNLTLNNPIYKNHLFLPIKDMTSGEETYGGGRYLDLKMDEILEGKIILDFNKLYNPWCAYSDGFNCPIPPKENHLSLSIKAGERNYLGEVKH